MTTTIATGSSEFTAHIDGEVAVLAFNRPERRNALTAAMYPAIATALEAARVDDNVRVVMLTGAGGAFCAGGDVKAMNASHSESAAPQPSFDDSVADLRRRQRMVSLAMHEFPKPIVAAIDGAAAGAGFSMAMAADLRIASPRSLMVTAFSSIGASGDFGGSWFLTRLLGEAKAKELYFRSPRLSAGEALDIGLLTEVLDAEPFDAAALAWCRELAERAPLAMSKIKENINRASVTDLATALDAEAINMRITMSSDDHKEAAAAFVEKRTPTFRGR